MLLWVGVGFGSLMCGWMFGWRFWRVRMSQLSIKLKLELKVGLAILKNNWGGWVVGLVVGWVRWLEKLGLKLTSVEVEAELGKKGTKKN